MVHLASTIEHGEGVVLDARRKRMILVAMCVALMAVIASVSGLNVAQQELALEFGASQSAILWVINAYTLALAAFLMPIGAVGDRWGRKPVLITGLGLFAVSSVAAALAGSVELMIAARSVAGLAAAMIMPVTLSVITSSFPVEERAQAIGVWAGVAGGGGLIGIFVSAATIDLLTWRWLFMLPIGLVVVSLVISLRFVPNSRELSQHRFDIGGSVLSLVAIGGIVLGVHEGPERGWTHDLTLAGLGVGALAVVGFVMWERRQVEPLLDIGVFADRRLAAGSLSLLALFGVMSGIFLVLFPYFQAVLGWSGLRSASAMIPMAAVMMPASTLVPRLSARIGSRRTLLVGLALATGGLALLAVLASSDGGYLSVLPGLLVIGLGFGVVMTPSTEAITLSLPADKQGVASALNDTTREVGGAVGVALLGAVLAAGYERAITPNLDAFAPEVAAAASEGIGAAFGVAPQAGDQAPLLIETARDAFVDAWAQTMWIGVVILAATWFYVWLRGPRLADAPDESIEALPDTGLVTAG